MDLNGIPLFAALKNKLGYLSEREKMISQNVANASTPGFTPTDLKPFSDQPGMSAKSSAVVLAQPQSATGITGGSASMIAIPGNSKDASNAFVSGAAPDSETTLNGNQVVLEEQMLKMNQARSEYDAAIGFYQKSLSMLQMAIKKPGA
jgi:flagellar basal-body rod protein FlgB